MIALDNSNLTDTITVSENAVTSMQQKGVMRMSVIAGQQMTMKEALHALLINSANDIAVAIAEHISGSTEDFTALMNEYAKISAVHRQIFQIRRDLTLTIFQHRRLIWPSYVKKPPKTVLF